MRNHRKSKSPKSTSAQPAALHSAPANAATKKPTSASWKPGQSGNPRGREPGSINASTRLRKMINAEAIIAKLEQAALAGDVPAARTLLERALPVHRATAAPVEIPALTEAKNFTDKADALLAAVADGRLAPDIGAALISAVGGMAKLAEIDELRNRVGALEARNVAHRLSDDELMAIASRGRES